MIHLAVIIILLDHGIIAGEHSGTADALISQQEL